MVRRGQNLPGRYFWSATGAPSDVASKRTDETSAVARRESSDVVYPRATTNSTSVPVSTSANGTFTGCFEIDGGLDVNAGATGSFFGIFSKSTEVELFSKDFKIFSVRVARQRRIITSSHTYPFCRNASLQAHQILGAP